MRTPAPGRQRAPQVVEQAPALVWRAPVAALLARPRRRQRSTEHQGYAWYCHIYYTWEPSLLSRRNWS